MKGGVGRKGSGGDPGRAGDPGGPGTRVSSFLYHFTELSDSSHIT